MCTVVILRRPDHIWPIILGANRDEMRDRLWQPPGRHWPDRPEVTAGLDLTAGGTWMGVNDHDVVACVLNRHGSLGPAPGKRSRGELVLEALDHADAVDAAEALGALDPAAYRSFNLIVADNRDAWWLSSAEGAAHVRMEPIPVGLSMFTAFDRNDPNDPRIATYLPRFEAAAPPDPSRNQWQDWQKLLASTDARESRAMSFKLESGFGTSSSSLLALPSAAAIQKGADPIWLFAAGPPESAPFRPVDMFGAPAVTRH